MFCNPKEIDKFIKASSVLSLPTQSTRENTLGSISATVLAYLEKENRSFEAIARIFDDTHMQE
jgi:hypothetical protein